MLTLYSFFFFFNDPATTEIYTLSLHDALPISLVAYLAAATPRGTHRRDSLLALFWPELDQPRARAALRQSLYVLREVLGPAALVSQGNERSEEHTSELQSRLHLVCRLLLEKKN